jgi:hypothetical protein
VPPGRSGFRSRVDERPDSHCLEEFVGLELNLAQLRELIGPCWSDGMLGVFVAHARVFHPAAGIPVAASGDVAVPNVFTSWVSEELVIAKSSPTHRRMRSTLGVSDGGPFPGSSAIGSAEAPRHFKNARSIARIVSKYQVKGPLSRFFGDPFRTAKYRCFPSFRADSLGCETLINRKPDMYISGYSCTICT